MSHKHENLLRAIFHDPVSGNIQWREIESLFGIEGVNVLRYDDKKRGNARHVLIENGKLGAVALELREIESEQGDAQKTSRPAHPQVRAKSL